MLDCYHKITTFLIFSSRHCGVEDPSWSELRHFSHFLSIQLDDCQSSVFCDPAYHDIESGFTGFKTFVVRFMIKMAMVCIIIMLHHSQVIYVTMRTACQLVKQTILSFIKPIREGVGKNKSHTQVLDAQLSKPYPDWFYKMTVCSRAY